MIIHSPAPAFIPRKRKYVVFGHPPAVLTLVAASADFNADVPTVTMQFDRPVNVSGMDVASVQVGTFVTGGLYAGFGTPTLADARTVVVSLEPVGSYGGADTELTAAAGNGVVAVDDGGGWAGVSDVGLPFP